MKKHSNALVFFAVSKQIPIVYSADRGRAENIAALQFKKLCNTIFSLQIWTLRKELWIWNCFKSSFLKSYHRIVTF